MRCLSHPASIHSRFTHIAVALAGHPAARLAAIFGPQHGFRSDVQENMIETGHGRDDARRVPVYSLYSETREPTAEMLEGLDVLVIDLQDVGTRIYPYLYPMAHCLPPARPRGLHTIVCQRPNPLGGATGGWPGRAHGQWRDEFNGVVVEGGRQLLAKLLGRFPVGLLVRV